jgi:SAM-dependent methyltransferase/predicted enzyme related to lactoylglutathione lyase
MPQGFQEFYHSFAEQYDAMTSDKSRWRTERHFLSGLLAEHGWQRILDAGCGTGGEAITLAGLGVEVVGVDATFSLLEVARQKAGGAGANVDWFHDDIRVLKHPALTKFDAVFCRGNTLPHLLKYDDLRAAFRSFHRVTRPGGNLVVGWLNYHCILDLRERLVGARVCDDHLFVRFYDFHEDRLTFNLLMVATDLKTSLISGKADVSWHSTALTPWTLQQVEPVLVDTGWSVVARWGGIDKQPFDSDKSTDILLVCRSVEWRQGVLRKQSGNRGTAIQVPVCESEGGNTMITRIWDVTLTVSDLKKSIGFYQDLMGLVKKYEFKDYAGFDCGGVELGLKTWGEREKPREGEPCINFMVKDVDEAYRVLRDRGVNFTKEPSDTLWGSRMALCSDPDGHVLQLTTVNWDDYFSVCATK